jgi:hypothetical protein
VAPDDIFTVRTYGTRQLCGHPASAHFQSPQPAKPQVSKSSSDGHMLAIGDSNHGNLWHLVDIAAMQIS